MAKIIITSEGQFLREVELDKERVTIGRKPFNDIALDHRAVSSQHATITLMLEDAMLEDLGSTNGTFVKGEKVHRQKLTSGQKVTIAIFELEYLASAPRKTPSGRIEVMSGSHKGKQLTLNKPLTTVGKPGSAVMAITYADGTYCAATIEGEIGPVINDKPLESDQHRLADGDKIDLAGTMMTFRHS